MDPENPAKIDTLEKLRGVYAGPRNAAKLKCLDRLDEFSRLFIAWSPFFVLASSNAEGRCDASPRGDQPGFVEVVDDKTLQFPDRPGNNRLDTMTNLLTNGGVGMLFFIPGFDESLRINGVATISLDAALRDRFAVNGKPALAVVRVTVGEVYFHCGKALKRSRLWDPRCSAIARRFDARPDPGGADQGRVGPESAMSSKATVSDCTEQDDVQTRKVPGEALHLYGVVSMPFIQRLSHRLWPSCARSRPASTPRLIRLGRSR